MFGKGRGTIDPGNYPHRLEFQKKTETKDEILGVVETWPCAFTTWGAFEPAGGSEFFMSQKRQAESTARVRIPHRSTINAGTYPSEYRIKHANRFWDIQSAEDMPSGIPVEVHFEVSEVK